MFLLCTSAYATCIIINIYASSNGGGWLRMDVHGHLRKACSECLPFNTIQIRSVISRFEEFPEDKVTKTQI